MRRILVRVALVALAGSRDLYLSASSLFFISLLGFAIAEPVAALTIGYSPPSPGVVASNIFRAGGSGLVIESTAPFNVQVNAQLRDPLIGRISAFTLRIDLNSGATFASTPSFSVPGGSSGALDCNFDGTADWSIQLLTGGAGNSSVVYLLSPIVIPKASNPIPPTPKGTSCPSIRTGTLISAAAADIDLANAQALATPGATISADVGLTDPSSGSSLGSSSAELFRSAQGISHTFIANAGETAVRVDTGASSGRRYFSASGQTDGGLASEVFHAGDYLVTASGLVPALTTLANDSVPRGPAGLQLVGGDSTVILITATDLSPWNASGIFDRIFFTMTGTCEPVPAPSSSSRFEVDASNTFATAQRLFNSTSPSVSDRLSLCFESGLTPITTPQNIVLNVGTFFGDTANLIGPVNAGGALLALLATDGIPAPTVEQVRTLTMQGDGESISPVPSASGRFVVVQTRAGNLAKADTNLSYDVYLVDTLVGTTTRVSVDDGEAQISGDSIEPSVSASGRLVAFVARDSAVAKVFGENEAQQAARTKGLGFGVYLRDLLVGTTQRLAPARTDGIDTQPQLSANGNAIVYVAPITDPLFGLIGQDNVFLLPFALGPGGKVNPGALRCVSCKSISAMGIETTENANGRSLHPTLSADGSVVAWDTVAKNMLSGTPSPCMFNGAEVWMRNMISGLVQLVSAPPSPSQCGTAGSISSSPRIDWSGLHVTYESNLPIKPGDINLATDAYFFDLVSRQNTRVSEGAIGVDGNGASREPDISGDGSVIVFTSAASNLDGRSADTNARVDVHVRALAETGPRRLSKTSTGVESNGDSNRPALNYNGTEMVYDSIATNLAPGISAGFRNVFLRANPAAAQRVFGTGFE